MAICSHFPKLFNPFPVRLLHLHPALPAWSVAISRSSSSPQRQRRRACSAALKLTTSGRTEERSRSSSAKATWGRTWG